MKALVKTKKEKGFELREVPKPSYQSNEVLIKIKHTSICGTDLHIYLWDQWAEKRIKLPRIIGHEFMGEIVAIGNAVTSVKVGDRVAAEGHITCGICRNCRGKKRHLCPNVIGLGIDIDGAFAEYLALPEENIILLPSDISDDVATILDPFGNAVHATLCFDLIGEEVLITGSGPIGLMACSIAKFAGAENIVISDKHEYRLNLAKKLGANTAINIQNLSIKDYMQSLEKTPEFTLGLEMSGSVSAVHDQIDYLYPGGHIALLGIFPDSLTIDLNKIIFKGLTIKGIYGRKMFDTWHKMISLIKAGLDLKPIITHHFSIDEYEKAFELLINANAGKIIINW